MTNVDYPVIHTEDMCRWWHWYIISYTNTIISEQTSELNLDV